MSNLFPKHLQVPRKFSYSRHYIHDRRSVSHSNKPSSTTSHLYYFMSPFPSHASTRIATLTTFSVLQVAVLSYAGT
ncbi:hypothetical protein P692DRAFT_20574706 [Suillus brevipes Sb2]|nr:hypothetical protein P692DRAFT_20574706 [Suillus brevipes Sb2]